MKKRIAGRKLGRGRGARKALYRSLTKHLVEHGSITTTKAKAKSILPYVERLVKDAKRNDVSSRRKVYAALGNDRETTDALFSDIALRMKDRTGGYIKITEKPVRRGDSAKMVKISWSAERVESKSPKKASKKASLKDRITRRKPKKS